MARTDPAICGSHAARAQEEMFLHRRALLERAKLGPRAAAAPATSHDSGNIVVLESADGVLAKRNSFNLDTYTLRFQLAAGQYKYDVRPGGFDANAATGGTYAAGLGDDDSRQFTLPFPFTFFGVTYNSVFLNSDGNLTFGEGDSATADRSLGRMIAGPPRISPQYEDLDPSRSGRGVHVLADSTRWVATWNVVPEYTDSGVGNLQTFQVILYPDGKIEFSYSGAAPSAAVVGIAPGRLQGSSSLASFLNSPSTGYTSAVAERFGGTDEIDLVTAAQKVFETHEDTYDYLVFYNTLGVQLPGAVAQYTPVRNSRTGMGDPQVDDGLEYGSPRRLQGVMNMSSMDQYPNNPNGVVPLRSFTGDTPLTILGHEAGHMFLAYVSVREPEAPRAKPMLTSDLFHWSFRFNTEASVLSGNRIADNGLDAFQRFTTTATVEAYSPLDQYLMGLRQPEEVPPTFYVKDPVPSSVLIRLPQVGVSFNGTRRDVTIEEIVATEGRRRPDATVSQRLFRFAFVLIVPAGTTPADAQLQQIETYRSNFETAFAKYAGGRATADTSLKKSTRLSLWPMSGVLSGKSITATVTRSQKDSTPLSFSISAPKGVADVPGAVVIPAGATQASFTVRGLRAGVEEFSFTPSDPGYENTLSRVQVMDGAAPGFALSLVSGDQQVVNTGKALTAPVVARLSDVNHVPYPGVRVSAAVTTGGTLDQGSQLTDENGLVSFKWSPGTGALNELTLTPDSASPVVAVALSKPAFTQSGLLNAASFQPSIAPGSIATLFGTNLAGAQIAVGGVSAQVFYSSNRQINFLIPASLPSGAVDFGVANAAGVSPAVKINLVALAPGIFFDAASGFGAVIDRGQRVFEVYATGFAPGQTVEADAGGVPAQVLYSGSAPGFPGLMQVNIQVANSVASGAQNLLLRTGGQSSNTVKIKVN